MQKVNFDVTKSEMQTIRSIVDRAVRTADKKYNLSLDRIETQMDLCATHANGCPIRFDELLTADDFNFMHDVLGIRKHLNRETGQLENCFTPRFAKPVATNQVG